MKKYLLLALAIISVISITFSACGAPSASKPKQTSTSLSSNEEAIKALDKKIKELQEEQFISDTESKRQIEELQAELEKLRAEVSSGVQTTLSTPKDSTFTYTLNKGKALITGFNGSDEHIVIPSRIDGFEVYGISANAFEGYSFSSVIISDGVEHIDWFAFYNCPKLSSITIPASVTSIGYSAFDGSAKGFTIYCHSNSFAYSYAKSYGITYTFI